MKVNTLKSSHGLYLQNILSLFYIIFIHSFPVALMSKSNFGISSLTAVPYLLSKIFTFFKFGTWTFLIQSLLILSLFILGKKIKLNYIFSFILAFCFSRMIDVHMLWLSALPDIFILRVVYFLIAFILMSVGVVVCNNSRIPILPTDLFPKDFAVIFSISYTKTKTLYDIAFLAVALFLSLGILHQFSGLGIGSVFCALFTGKTVDFIQILFAKKRNFFRIEKTVPPVL